VFHKNKVELSYNKSMSDGPHTEKNFFEFTDFRELLRHLYLQNKKTSDKFSYRFFARLAGFNSPAFLKRVIDGESKLSEDSIKKIAKGFKMSQDETHFFRHLVLLNQSSNMDEKKRFASEIFKSRNYRKFHPLSHAQYNYYSLWYFVPVRELVGLPQFREDYDWVAKAIIPNITAEQAKKAVEELIAIGLLKRDDSGGLMQSERVVITPDEVVSSAVGLWHREMMKKATESIDTVPREFRDISAVTFRASKESLKKAKLLVQKFRKELVEELMADPSDSIYELNIQLFPLTNFTGEDEGGESKK
jgi:uncharacterized protein (TIGR02147 family)